MQQQQDMLTILSINDYLQHTNNKLHITRDSQQIEIFTVDLTGAAYSIEGDGDGVPLTDDDYRALAEQMRAQEGHVAGLLRVARLNKMVPAVDAAAQFQRALHTLERTAGHTQRDLDTLHDGMMRLANDNA